MNQLHPKSSRIILCALVAGFVAATGCRSSSSNSANPFMAPDRVAPPSTRALAPGQAQPYYQGDPMPAIQSAAGPPTNSALATTNPAESRSATGRTLGWGSPAGAPVAQSSAVGAPAPTATGAAPWGVNPPVQSPVVAAKEAPVAVPNDASELRFPLAAPTPPATVNPIAAAPVVGQPTQPAPVALPNPGVALASYNAPVTTQPNPAVTGAYAAPTFAPAPAAPPQPGAPPVAYAPAPVAPPASPWQSPQVAANMYGMEASPYQPVVVQPVPTAAPTNQVAVQLRAVPPPPPQPGDPVPRIRIPGYDETQTASADGFHARTSMR